MAEYLKLTGLNELAKKAKDQNVAPLIEEVLGDSMSMEVPSTSTATTNPRTAERTDLEKGST